MQKEPFCFDGEWVYDDSDTSEDVYWKMDQWRIDECINILEDNDYHCNKLKNHKKQFKNKDNYYKNKLYGKYKLQKLKNSVYWTVWEKNKYLEEKPYYLIRAWFSTNTKRFYKKWSNKQVRKNNEFSLRGNSYRRVFNLQNEIW